MRQFGRNPGGRVGLFVGGGGGGVTKKDRDGQCQDLMRRIFGKDNVWNSEIPSSERW